MISCFDRALFRGYLPILSGYAMAQFLCHEQILYKDLKSFLIANAAALKDHAVAMARTAARPYIYLASSGVRKEERAQQFADRPTSVKMNWIKMYDKVGSVLRVETVINEPDAFKVRKRVWREGLQVTEWVPMRKGVANLFRYRDVSLAANAPYLDALAIVDDPGTAIRQLHSITSRKRTRSGHSVRAFNPLSEEDQHLFKAVLSGDNAIPKRGRIQFA